MKNLLSISLSVFILSCNLEVIPDTGPFQCGQEFTDPRDGKKYKTVYIAQDGSHNLATAGHCWFAQNANFNTANFFSSCYDQDNGLCDSLGRVYHKFSINDACPGGWHLATTEEWEDLFDAYSWTKLITGNGPIFSGDSAVFLPGGMSGMNFLMGGGCDTETDCNGLGDNIGFWASDNVHTTFFNKSGNSSIFALQFINEDLRYYIRCVKDSI